MLEDIKNIKLYKLEKLRKAGLDPYPEKTKRSMTNREALDRFDSLQGREIYLVGRVRSLRPMGGSTFCHIEDESGKIQFFLTQDKLGKDKYNLFLECAELGDFIGAKGKLFKTQTGEITLEISDWKMLTKSLLPIPTEYFGLKDKEKLLRRRYLDLMMNPETREIFRKKNVFWQTVRGFLARRGFLEVQIPILENIPGGAEAEPFKTRHEALGRDYYMRISLELGLKRLLVGGYEKVFEIGRVFRNEGIDREHLQEYDMVEFYSAYTSLEEGMRLVKEMYQEIIKNLLLQTKQNNFLKGNDTGLSRSLQLSSMADLKTEYDGNQIDWNGEWERKDYFELFNKETGVDLSEEISINKLRKRAEELGIEYKLEYGKGRMIDLLFKKIVRPKIIQPCFLVGHPVEVSPLAKRDPRDSRRVLRVQVIAGGTELGNGFSELNDPIDQKARFEEQMKLREAGDKEAQMLDEDFVEALEYGMPPAFGFGFSERLFAFLMNKSVRETVIFPPMREK